jgi:hypothetical protein
MNSFEDIFKTNQNSDPVYYPLILSILILVYFFGSHLFGLRVFSVLVKQGVLTCKVFGITYFAIPLNEVAEIREIFYPDFFLRNLLFFQPKFIAVNSIFLKVLFIRTKSNVWYFISPLRQTDFVQRLKAKVLEGKVL